MAITMTMTMMMVMMSEAMVVVNCNKQGVVRPTSTRASRRAAIVAQIQELQAAMHAI